MDGTCWRISLKGPYAIEIDGEHADTHTESEVELIITEEDMKLLLVKMCIEANYGDKGMP